MGQKQPNEPELVAPLGLFKLAQQVAANQSGDRIGTASNEFTRMTVFHPGGCETIERLFALHVEVTTEPRSAESPGLQPVRPQEPGAAAYVWTVEYLWNVDRLRREGWQATAPVNPDDTRGAYHLRRTVPEIADPPPIPSPTPETQAA